MKRNATCGNTARRRRECDFTSGDVTNAVTGLVGAGARPAVAADSPPVPVPARSPLVSELPPLLMDGFYLGGLLFSVPYLFLLGRGRRVVEHLRRRTRATPARRGSRPCVWVHGVSVGEILSARSFIERFLDHHPGWEVVLSTTTRAGLEAGRRQYGDNPLISTIISYPFDLSPFVKRAFDRVRPDLVVIVEHELWPNFLTHAKRRDVPVVLVNGRLSPRSLKGYRFLSKFTQWPPRGIGLYCVEDEVSAERFRRLGVPADRIKVTGNFKFDNASTGHARYREGLGLNGKHWVLVAASLHGGEETPVLDSFDALYREDRDSRLVLAPRRLEGLGELSRQIERRGFRVLLWSQISGANGNGANGVVSDRGALDRRGEVLLVDTFGDLRNLVGVGDAVFVGGSLVPFGGHNVIEPARSGRPVVIGPHYQNFQYVVSSFLENDALVVANDAEDLTAKLSALKRDRIRANAMAGRASRTVELETGASERALEAMRPLIDRVESRARR